MKTFDEIYNELENNNNEELNSAWIEAKEQNKKTKKIGLTIIAILDICIVLGLLKAKSIYRMLPVLPAIFTIYIITIAIIFIATKLGKKQAEFIRKYKNIVVKKIISNFYNNLEYREEILKYLLPAVYRIKNNFKLHKELDTEKVNFEVFEKVKEGVLENNRYLSEPLRDEEILYITESVEEFIKYENIKKISLKKLLNIVKENSDKADLKIISEKIKEEFGQLIDDDTK